MAFQYSIEQPVDVVQEARAKYCPPDAGPISEQFFIDYAGSARRQRLEFAIMMEHISISRWQLQMRLVANECMPALPLAACDEAAYNSAPSTHGENTNLLAKGLAGATFTIYRLVSPAVCTNRRGLDIFGERLGQTQQSVKRTVQRHIAAVSSKKTIAGLIFGNC